MYKKIYKNMRLFTLLTLILTSALILRTCYVTFNEYIKQDIKGEAFLIAGLIEKSGYEKLDFITDRRISVIDFDGRVLYDNDYNADKMDNHKNRPEVAAAIESGQGESRRHSITLGTSFYYYACKIDDGRILRIAGSTNSIFQLFGKILIHTFLILAGIYLAAVFLSKRLTKTICEPIINFDVNHVNYDNIYEEIYPFLKKIETQNREINNQIEKVKRHNLKMQAISDNLNEGLVVFDDSGNILTINNTAQRIFNTNTKTVIGQSIWHLSRNLEVSEKLGNALKGFRETYTLKLDTKTYEIFFSPVAGDEILNGVIMLMVDISEKAYAEKLRREFSANVSHELKTPLTSILGYAQIINKDIAKPGDIKLFADKIENEAKSVISLIEDIIKLSKLDEQAEAEKKTINLFSIAKHVIEMLLYKAESKNVQMILDGEDTQIYGNEQQLTELIFNLTDNAIKYNKHGGSVMITVKETYVSVQDTGIGIPKEYSDRVFERFFRVDKSHSKNEEGTGLGLSIVKHIALGHDGEIFLESEVGIGTKITVNFNKSSS